MKNIKPWLIAITLTLAFFGAWQFLSHYFVEHEQLVRRHVRQTITEKFPTQAEEYAQSLGLFPYKPVEETNKSLTDPTHTIVLIHGLDDPGKVWMNLAPELVSQGFNVQLMHYPNDQPITDSTQFFFQELVKLRQVDVKRISIVAHSMGGLVTRDLLTDPAIDYHFQAAEEIVPEVDQFIMVGTPNHGSQIARFRAFGEVRDQLDRLAKGQMNGLGFILDGAGEAKIDLLPGSQFLTTLNQRAHPKDVEMFIIAGVATPWAEGELSVWLKGVKQTLGRGQSKNIEQLEQVILSMSDGLGDGLVTVQSTRLPGIEHRKVKGTHLTMIRNISEGSDRIPPAVPLIIEQLRQ